VGGTACVSHSSPVGLGRPRSGSNGWYSRNYQQNESEKKRPAHVGVCGQSRASPEYPNCSARRSTRRDTVLSDNWMRQLSFGMQRLQEIKVKLLQVNSLPPVFFRGARALPVPACNVRPLQVPPEIRLPPRPHRLFQPATQSAARRRCFFCRLLWPQSPLPDAA